MPYYAVLQYIRLGPPYKPRPAPSIPFARIDISGNMALNHLFGIAGNPCPWRKKKCTSPRLPRSPHVRLSRPPTLRHEERAVSQGPRPPGQADQRSGALGKETPGRGFPGQNQRIPRTTGQRQGAGRPAPRGLRPGARGLGAHPGATPFRRPAPGRHRPAPGQNRRDENRRRQNPGGHPARGPQRHHGAGRACDHGERLSGPPRLGMDGNHIQLPRPVRGGWWCTGSPTRSAKPPTART